MIKPCKALSILLIILSNIMIFIANSSANNLTINNIFLQARNPSSNTVVVQFDVSWENSWKTKINHDAAWITIRLYDPSVTPNSKNLCELSASGLNPTGTTVDSDLEIYVPADKKGLFIRPADYGTFETVSSASTQVKIDYSTCGFAQADSVNVSVFGVEMVYIPEGAFYAGDYEASGAALHQGSSDSDPWYISSSSAISVTNAVSNGYRYVSASNTSEDTTGASFTIAATFPKGYSPFYVMKYELTEEQWAEFVNSLPSAAARSNRDVTNSSHKNSDTVVKRNTLSCSGSPLSCATDRSARAVNYISWMDLAAFLDWAALRPVSELEFEKAARGPVLPVAGEFSWGSTAITAATTISGSDENGTEMVTTSAANAHYGDNTLSGGDSANGADYQKGPLRAGIFAQSSATRTSAGGGYYGVLELSGNLRERVVTIGNTTGRAFTGTHGDGILSTASGFEGNATNSDWPGIDGTPARGVSGADGSGSRGGGWEDSSTRLRISDRSDAANADASALSNSGGRGARSYE